MRNLSYTLIASLALNGLALPSAALAAEEQICATTTYTPDIKSETEIPGKCGSGTYAKACINTRTAIFKWSNKYKEIAESACKKHRASIGEINELNQSASQEKVAATAEAAKKSIEDLLAANKTYRRQIPVKANNNALVIQQIANTPTATAEFKKNAKRIGEVFSRAKSQPEVLRNDGVKESDGFGISSVSSQDAKAQLEALGQAQEFVRALFIDKDKNEAAIRELDQAKNNAIRNQDNTRSAETTKDSGSGFNPLSLLPLAAPLAGLLMQQKAQQDSGLSDGLTPPTDPYAMNPTEPAPLDGTSLEPAPLDGTSLDTNSGSQTPGSTAIAGLDGQGTGMQMPVDTYAGDDNAANAPSDGSISQKGEKGRSAGMGSLGSFNANAGSGASNSSGGTTGGGKNDRKPANTNAAASEEGMIGSGGGGMGFSPSASSDTETSDGMKDMLQDMEATLENEPTGLFAEVDQANSADGVAPENSESLFPRVSACYIRNLKKGFVLNGLGEKLPESESH